MQTRFPDRVAVLHRVSEWLIRMQFQGGNFYTMYLVLCTLCGAFQVQRLPFDYYEVEEGVDG